MGVVEEADEVEEVDEDGEDDGDRGEVNGAVFVRAPVLLLAACPHSTVASVATADDSDAFGSEKNRLRRMWVRDFGGPPAATTTGGCCSREEGASLKEPVESGGDSNDCNGFDSFL